MKVTLATRAIPCAMCERLVEFETTTNLDEGCPEMFAAAPGAGPDRVFFGILEDEAHNVTVIVLCGANCLAALVRQGPQ